MSSQTRCFFSRLNYSRTQISNICSSLSGLGNWLVMLARRL
uniref:Uncharacterized protein n=1 Tax=Arundo donax TaxID=35708 RepID=A0A0A9DRA5_ARUDO